MSTKQEDKAAKRVKRGGSAAWNRDRMNETHRKGKRGSKKQVRRAQRRVGKEMTKAELLAQTKRDAEIIARMAARVNFVINTSLQHTQSVPEWVVKTLEGKNPHAELSDDDPRTV